MSSSDLAAWVQAIGSILAVTCAAFIAVWQQHKTKQLQDERRDRKNAAARALLPLTLLDIAAYIKNNIVSIKEFRLGREAGSRAKFYFHELPVAAIKDLKGAIEFADVGPQERLAKIVEQLQILHSRLSTINDPNRLTTDFELVWRIVDSLDIYARIDLLFPYARKQKDADPGEPHREQMHAAASICDCLDDLGVSDYIEKHYQQQTKLR